MTKEQLESCKQLIPDLKRAHKMTGHGILLDAAEAIDALTTEIEEMQENSKHLSDPL